jgi:hypothetical protein
LDRFSHGQLLAAWGDFELFRRWFSASNEDERQQGEDKRGAVSEPSMLIRPHVRLLSVVFFLGEGIGLGRSPMKSGISGGASFPADGTLPGFAADGGGNSGILHRPYRFIV